MLIKALLVPADEEVAITSRLVRRIHALRVVMEEPSEVIDGVSPAVSMWLNKSLAKLKEGLPVNRRATMFNVWTG